MFRYWVYVNDEVTWTDNDMFIPLNMFSGPNNQLIMNYDADYLVVIF